MPIGAQLANRSAALLREVSNGLLSAEGYSEPTQTSEMKLFTAIVDGIKPYKQFSQKNLTSSMFDEVLNTSLIQNTQIRNAVLTNRHIVL